MAKIRRGGFILVTWKGDHPPQHVHVYRDGELVVKCDLEHNAPMRGAASKALIRLIQELRDEGRL